MTPLPAERLAAGRYRLTEAATIETGAAGAVRLPAGYVWAVGLAIVPLPARSEALKVAALVHDRLYDGPRSWASLAVADRAATEVYLRAGGRTRWLPPVLPILWIWRGVRLALDRASR